MLEICPTPPTDAQLALNNPDDKAQEFAPTLNLQLRYWQREQFKAEQSDDEGHQSIAESLATRLTDASCICQDLRDQYFPPISASLAKEYILSTLAVALLTRYVIRLGTGVINQAQADSTTTPILDMKIKNGIPLPPRWHMTEASADELLPPAAARNQWYRRGNLYIRRRKPAQPSPPLIQLGYKIDYSSMVSLYPYMASRRTSPT